MREARQKRILVDEEYYYMDMVFYNRAARFGVILELKSHRLDYKDVAQLNMYLSYYRKNMMQEDDNPPVGILLCTAAGKRNGRICDFRYRRESVYNKISVETALQG